MTRRDLTPEEEEEDIPAYISTPFVEDGLYFAYCGDQLVWSEEGKLPWYFNKDNEEIQSQDFEERFPGYNQLTDILVDKDSFSAKYKGTYVHWSFKREQWRYRNHRPVTFKVIEGPPEEKESPESEDEQAEVSQLLESTVLGKHSTNISALVTQLSRPQTPQIPQTPCTTQALPGEFPSTPGPSSQVSVTTNPSSNHNRYPSTSSSITDTPSKSNTSSSSTSTSCASST